MDFGEELRNYREALRPIVSQDKMAFEVGIAPSTYKRFEHKKGRIGIAVTVKLFNYLQSVNEFELSLNLLDSRGFNIEKLPHGFEDRHWHRPPILPNHHDIVWVALAGENFPQVAHFLENESGCYFLYKGLRLSIEEVEMWRYREILPSKRGANDEQKAQT